MYLQHAEYFLDSKLFANGYMKLFLFWSLILLKETTKPMCGSETLIP